MYKVNDYVMYISTGVCQVIDIITEKQLSSSEVEYYVLEPVYNKSMVIKTPVNNQKVVMRDVISKDKALSLISKASKDTPEWIENDKERFQEFKAALREGTSEAWMRIVNTLELKKEEKIVQGKRLTKVDDDTMKIAKKQLYEEFSVALGMSPEDGLSYVKKNLS